MKILASPEETGTANLSVLLVEFEAGQGTPVHTHDGVEVMFVVDGEGTSVEDGKTSKITTHSVVVAPKGVPHQIVNGSGAKMHMITIYTPPLPGSYIQANYKKVPAKKV